MPKKASLSKHPKGLLISDPMPKTMPSQDLYEFSKTVNRMKSLLEDCETPYTIGIYGPWGSGKSTLKNLLIDQIKNDLETKLLPIDFDAWIYEQDIGILFPLINQLITEAGLKDSDLKRIIPIIAIACSSILLKASTGGTADFWDFTKSEKYAIDNFQRYSKYVSALSKTRDDFGYIIQALIAQGKKAKSTIEKVIIFIDELDRCNPDNAIRLLESIKNLFDANGCVFAILVDDTVLASYVDKKYENTRMDGYMYLEKIVNTKFSTPEVRAAHIHSLKDEISQSLLFDIDADLLVRFSSSATPRRLQKIYEKVLLYLERKVEGVDSNTYPELSRDPLPIRNKKVFLLLVLNDFYPRIYRDVQTWDKDYYTRIKSRLNEAFSSANFSLFGDVAKIVNLQADEIFILSYLFKVFSWESLIETQKMLRETSLI